MSQRARILAVIALAALPLVALVGLRIWQGIRGGHGARGRRAPGARAHRGVRGAALHRQPGGHRPRHRLLQNAIKYSPEGGEIELELARSESGTQALLTVADRGIGIPPEDLERVFERFERGSNVVGRIGGTGIGLAGARQIIEQHGGTIAVASRVGEGTLFTVRLPAQGEAAAPATDERRAA